jgi:tetratricopeptide (TPR) repeat protein
VIAVTGDGTRISIGADSAVLPLSRLHQLRPPLKDFTGRDAELAEVLTQIRGAGVTITGVRGLGGIGKTELAYALADRLEPDYPDAQLYLDLKGTTEPLARREVLAYVVRCFHPQAKAPDNDAELLAQYRSDLNGKRALLLMDNAFDDAQVADLCPPPAGCVLLVTSRQQFTLPGLFVKNLDTLSPEDARDLLLRICPRIGDAAERIAELCAWLPLALRLAGGALAKRRNLSPGDYVHRLSDAQRRLKHLDKVEGSLRLSDTLLADQLRRAWYALSVFPGTFDQAATAAVWGVEPDRAQDTLGELLHYSVLELNEGTGRYRLHDLVRIYAGEQLAADERRTAQYRHAEHYCGVLRAAEAEYLKGGDAMGVGLALADAEWPNIQAGAAWARGHAESSLAALALVSKYPDAGAYVLDLRLHPRQYADWLEAAVAAARKLGDRAAEGRHLGNLGLAYADLGEPQRAIEYHEQALVISREIEDRRAEGQDLGNLGNAYAALGEPRRAIEFQEQHLEIARAIGDRHGEGHALGNLGNAYAALAEPRRAIEFYEQDLEIARALGDRHGEGQAFGNLGIAYAALGEPRRAIEFCEQQLTITRAIGDRRGEANACWNIGLAYEKLGDLPRAADLMQVCVDYERELGHPDAEKHAAEVAALRARLK